MRVLVLTAMKQLSLINVFLAYANRLKFRNLFLLTAGLFVANLLIPDMVPIIDELILGLLAVLLANWKKENPEDNHGETIEGEVIDNNNKE